MSAVHIKHLKKELAISYAAGTNLLLLSKPAVGKSMEARAWAKSMSERIEGFGFWPFDITTCSPNDVCVYMPEVKTGELVVYPNNVLPNAYKDPDAKGAVFVDEVLNGDPTTTKVFQKYFNGEDISGKLRKPDGVMVVAASNRHGDKAGVMQQSRAFLSRFEQVEVISDAPHNVWYIDNDQWYPTLAAFLKKFAHLIDNYDMVFEPTPDQQKGMNAEAKLDIAEEGKRGIWSNMRSWNRVSRLEYAAQALGLELNPARITSNVGKANGIQYQSYRATFDKIASVEQILDNPKKVEIPERIDMLYVMVCMLAQLVPQEKVNKAAIFVDRLPGDMRALAIRRLVKRSQKDRAAFDIGACDEYKAWMRDPAVSDLFMAAR